MVEVDKNFTSGKRFPTTQYTTCCCSDRRVTDFDAFTTWEHRQTMHPCNGTRTCSKVPLGWCISWARVSGSISSRAVTEMIAWRKENPGKQITGQREPKQQQSLHMRGHDILTHWCEINLMRADIWHVGYHCSYLGTMSFPRTTDVMNFFVYSTSGKLWQTRLHHNDFILL